MPGQGRLGDKAQVPSDAHGCPGCPHPGVGPAISGSGNVNVNGRPALRVDDNGMHSACCGPNTWQAAQGSSTVFINGKAAHRLGDATRHCGGQGKLIEGSSDVIVGDASSGGGGSGGQGGTSGGGGNGGAGKTGNSSGQGQEGQGQQAQQQQDQQQQNQQQNQPPKKKPIKWEVTWDDGKPLKGFTSRFMATSGGDEKDVDPDGSGNHDQGQHPEETTFTVAIIGKVKIQGQVKAHTGKAVVGARVRIERAFGPTVDTRTDSSGNWSAEGFVEDEPYEVSITEPRQTLEGRVEDHEGKPVVGAIVRIERSYAAPIEVKTDANGNYKAEGIVEDEDHHVTVLPPGEKAEGKVLDEAGKPVAGAVVRLEKKGEEPIEVKTDSNGVYRMEGFRELVDYSATIVTATGVAEGQCVNELGDPVAGVQGRIFPAHGGEPLTFSTDGSGQFSVKGLVPGEQYVLEIVYYKV